MDRQEILVGVSGGMDSAATVLMLQDAGYFVSALYVDMLGCDVQLQEAVELCNKMEVGLEVFDAVDLFKQQVISEVLREHARGRTPSPCTICNPRVKLYALREVALRRGISRIATGHYVCVENIFGRWYIKRGVDFVKDQSYYLWDVGQDILGMLMTPLGGMFKDCVRDYLGVRGYCHTAKKRESQGVCFARGGYGSFLERECDIVDGDVVDECGVVVGRHRGFQLYTIGQRRGFLHLSAGVCGEVCGIVPEDNRVVIGNGLVARRLILSDWWWCPFDLVSEQRVIVRGLGCNPSSCVSVVECVGGGLEVSFCDKDEIVWAPALGQPCVLYSCGVVIGGGILSDFL